MHNLIHEWHHLIATNYVGLASYTLLIYDHVLTFSDEVNYVWKGRWGPVIYLFVLNRYFFPLAFIVNLYAYMSSDFSYDMCHHFVRYEGATVVIGFGIAGLMMILRVNALYGGNCRRVQATLGVLWTFQIAVYAWLLSTGIPVPRSPGVHGCSLIFDPHYRGWRSLSAAAPLIFDTAVLLLTLYKTVGSYSNCRTGMPYMLLKTLFHDGVLYYIVVFSVNLALTIMIVAASPGLKNILGQFAQLITVTMMSRITLHLREIGARSRASVIVYAAESDRTLSSYELDSGAPLRAPEFASANASTGLGSEVQSSVDSVMHAPKETDRPESRIGRRGVGAVSVPDSWTSGHNVV